MADKVKLYGVAGLTLAGVKVEQEADGGFMVDQEDAGWLCAQHGMTSDPAAAVLPPAPVVGTGAVEASVVEVAAVEPAHESEAAVESEDEEVVAASDRKHRGKRR